MWEVNSQRSSVSIRSSEPLDEYENGYAKGVTFKTFGDKLQ